MTEATNAPADPLREALDALKWANDRLRECGKQTDFTLGMCMTLSESERRESKARATLSATREEGGWIVASGDGQRFRAWQGGCPCWTNDRGEAIRYARRQDAEAAHEEDEDAWSVLPYKPSDHRMSASEAGPLNNGYVLAFYEIAKLLGIGARACSPKECWEREMRPKLLKALQPGPAACTGRDLAEALKLAISHAKHMAAWIGGVQLEGKPPYGYSFEALGEDMPGMEAALANAGASESLAAIYRAALQDVVDPIAALERRCPAGHELNHSAVTIGNSLQFVQEIARAALSTDPQASAAPDDCELCDGVMSRACPRCNPCADGATTISADGDKVRLDFLAAESFDLRNFPVPTGGDDADIGWRVVGHWQAKPNERTIAEVFHDDPRAAIDAAMLAAATAQTEAGDGA
jgi:hypothetical protein